MIMAIITFDTTTIVTATSGCAVVWVVVVCQKIAVAFSNSCHVFIRSCQTKRIEGKRICHWLALVNWSGQSKSNYSCFKLILCCFLIIMRWKDLMDLKIWLKKKMVKKQLIPCQAHSMLLCAHNTFYQNWRKIQKLKFLSFPKRKKDQKQGPAANDTSS